MAVRGIVELRARLRALADPGDAAGMRRYFKEADLEDDRFLGIRAAELRRLAREYQALPFRDVASLLDSPWHEERALALLILVRRYAEEPDAVYALYFRKIARINSWDLVDVAARDIVGRHGDRAVLYELAKSKSVWKRRIALVATQFSIRRGEFTDTLRLAKFLLHDEHDLIHKAAGWMLREIGDRDRSVEESFLDQHAAVMPRTMLRYAIEKFPPALRRKYMEA